MDISAYLKMGTTYVLSYGVKILVAIAVLILGSWVIKLLGRGIGRMLGKMDVEETLRPYLQGILTTLLKVILYISVIGMLGIQTTSFVAILGAAGLAVGMALQGSLSNFAGGVLLLIFKPIKKGDFINAQGVSGVVESVQPFVTVVLSPDNIVHYIPNGAISSGAIANYSVHNERRVDLTFGIGYQDDIDKAKEVLRSVANSCDLIHKNLAPDVFVKELADSSVNFGLRVFCRPEHYWDVCFYLTEKVKKEFDNAGISIPFPQRDVHMHNA